MAISEDLTRDQIPFEIDYRSGTVLVPRERVAELRVRLGTTYGVAQDGTDRDKLVQDPPEPGTSSAWQNKRMVIALEKDLARDIARMQNIEAARVYLAVPRQSEFLRRQNAPRASVFVRPKLGRTINAAQAEGIRNLVAMSVANLDPAAVKIIGADGRAIGGQTDPVAEQADKMLEMKERLENYYQEQVYELLSPIVGRDNMRVEINAELDFSREDVTTVTHESGERNVVSQETSRQVGFGQMAPIGVPGALTNEPPAAGAVDPPQADADAGDEPPTPTSEREVKNMMPDKRTTRELKAPYRVQRLSAAVLIDDRVATGKGAKGKREPWPEEELKKLEELARQAIGYNDKRGDSISVSNHSFVPPVEIAAPEPEPLWEQAWVWDLSRQLLVALIAIVALFMIVRPALKSLSSNQQKRLAEEEAGSDAELALADGNRDPNGAEGGAEGAEQDGGMDLLPAPPNVYGDILNLAKVLADEDPKRVASVIKEWVSSDAE